MPRLSLLRIAPQRVLNTVVAALLLLSTPALADGGAVPPPQASLSLDDSTAAAQLASHLPRTLTFDDRMGTAVFAELPTALASEDADATSGYRAGDVAYVAADQSIVVFLTDGIALPDHGLVMVGHVTSGLDDVAGCVRDCAIELVVSPAAVDVDEARGAISEGG
jgi:hypothetical protein